MHPCPRCASLNASSLTVNTRARPAAEAGNRGDPAMIRTFGALQRTRLHLLRVMDDPSHSLHARQLFLWDRYRALRKDMNQQALARQGLPQLAWSITAVEEVVRFLLLVDAALMGEDKVRPFHTHTHTHTHTRTLTRAPLAGMSCGDPTPHQGAPRLRR
jgi:hypothetical protein